MTCYAEKVSTKIFKVLKRESISKDTYLLCEEEVEKRNKRLKTSFWKITHINI